MVQHLLQGLSKWNKHIQTSIFQVKNTHTSWYETIHNFEKHKEISNPGNLLHWHWNLLQGYLPLISSLKRDLGHVQITDDQLQQSMSQKNLTYWVEVKRAKYSQDEPWKRFCYHQWMRTKTKLLQLTSTYVAYMLNYKSSLPTWCMCNLSTNRTLHDLSYVFQLFKDARGLNFIWHNTFYKGSVHETNIYKHPFQMKNTHTHSSWHETIHNFEKLK